MVGHRISKGKILGQCSGLNPKKASAISDIIKCECASLVGLLAPKPDINQVLAPLVNTCYECQEGLVVNHQCQVKIIHTNVSDIGGKDHIAMYQLQSLVQLCRVWQQARPWI